MSEGAVVNACIRWLITHGCFVWRNNTGAYKAEGSKRYIRYGVKGSPDIIGTTPHGRFIGVECKHGKNTMQPSQKEFAAKLEANNALYIVAYGLDDLEARKGEIVGGDEVV